MNSEWPSQISDDDREVYIRSGFGNEVGFGERPALLVIDVQYRTVGPRKPVVEAIGESYPTACGERAWSAIDAMVPLLQVARDVSVPIFYPCVAPKSSETVGRFGAINPLVEGVDEKGYEFVAEIAPEPGDLPVPKLAASSFFGTPLASYLVDRQVDTVVLLGCTTSGCIRATAVDAFSYNFRTIVASDGVYDRAEFSHEVSLFELNAKYADVMSTDAILDEISRR